MKQACTECLRAHKQGWRKEFEFEPDDKILSSRVRILENRINKLEDLKTKIDSQALEEEKIVENTECQEQTLAIKDSKNNKMIQLKDDITSNLLWKKVVRVVPPPKLKKVSLSCQKGNLKRGSAGKLIMTHKLLEVMFSLQRMKDKFHYYLVRYSLLYTFKEYLFFSCMCTAVFQILLSSSSLVFSSRLLLP